MKPERANTNRPAGYQRWVYWGDSVTDAFTTWGASNTHHTRTGRLGPQNDLANTTAKTRDISLPDTHNLLHKVFDKQAVWRR